MMIKHIVVALDGTSLAEAALPQTKFLARLLQARVTLLHVIEAAAQPVTHGERHLTERSEAEDYLTGVARQFTSEGLTCQVHVHSDAVERVAGGIVAHEAELQPDLVVMCTHGPGKLERLLHGSLAQQVVSLGQTPLMLTHPQNRSTGLSGRLQNLLVALDGDEKHETGFEMACAIAKTGKVRLQLLSVVPELSSLAGRRASLSRYLPGASWFLQGMTRENLRTYLGKLLARAEEQGIDAAGEIQTGKVARTISARAEALNADLVVLATHGKAGTQAFWANSIAAQVQTQTTRSLLLVPV